jgi:hypothetical protein
MMLGGALFLDTMVVYMSRKKPNSSSPSESIPRLCICFATLPTGLRVAARAEMMAQLQNRFFLLLNNSCR